MIPAFPEFKKIEIGDREAIEAHTHRYPPYSDFNFTSLFSWDDGNHAISELNGNLVMLLSDYHTRKPFLSFIGAHDAASTAKMIGQYAESVGMSPVLRLVPEESAILVGGHNFLVSEDRSHFDYLFSTAEVAVTAGSRFKSIRHLIARFEREYLSAIYKECFLADESFRNEAMELFHDWKSKREESDMRNEEKALHRLFSQSSPGEGLIASGITYEGRMLAFSIDELLPEGYAISHFFKANRAYIGVSEYLNRRVAGRLQRLGITFWNWEQDLGLEQLRYSKMKYRPARFLRKYTIAPFQSITTSVLV